MQTSQAQTLHSITAMLVNIQPMHNNGLKTLTEGTIMLGSSYYICCQSGQTDLANSSTLCNEWSANTCLARLIGLVISLH